MASCTADDQAKFENWINENNFDDVSFHIDMKHFWKIDDAWVLYIKQISSGATARATYKKKTVVRSVDFVGIPKSKYLVIRCDPQHRYIVHVKNFDLNSSNSFIQQDVHSVTNAQSLASKSSTFDAHESQHK